MLGSFLGMTLTWYALENEQPTPCRKAMRAIHVTTGNSWVSHGQVLLASSVMNQRHANVTYTP